MPTELATVLVMAVVSIGGSWLVATQTARTLAEQSREAEVDDELARLAAAWSRIEQLERRVTELEDKRAVDALVKRAMGDHIDVLEAHIIRGDGPPPPPRPPGV
jgi:hypothetical protein